MNRKILIAAVLGVAILLCACSNGTATPDVSETPTQSTETLHVESSLDALRQLRADLKPPVAAVAHLGYFETEPEDSVMPWVREEYPQWLSRMDFIENIPPEKIIGSWGSLWCVVPRDPNATVAVNRVSTLEDSLPVEQVLYRSEDGDPILILADYSEDSTLSVVITDPDGEGIIWYPAWGQTQVFPEDAPAGSQLADFSPVSEKSEYELYIRNGWYAPTADELMDSFWLSDNDWGIELLPEPGDGVFDGKALLYSVDDGGNYTVTYRGSWLLEEGYLLLELIPLEDNGYLISGRFPVLLDPWGDGWLWIGRNENGAGIPYMPEDAEFDELTRPMG